MLFTIHRYIFRDLVKIFLLTTAILSLVLGLGVMLQPLRQFSVDPVRVPELLFCTLPVTMTMVLPIAALLAATLIYGRLAVDNEVNACRSSGISLLTLIYPALTLALLVGMATLLLSFHVIPNFVARSESIIKSDAEAIIYRNIEKKGNLGKMFPNYLIHADYADPENHRLFGVAILYLGDQGVELTITARQVNIELQESDGSSQIMLTLHDMMMTDIENNTGAGKKVPFSMPVPRLLRDDIKFKKLDQIKAIQENMMLFSPIRDLMESIRRRYQAELFFEWCDGQLAQKKWCDWKKGEYHYLDLSQPDHYLRIYAHGCAIRPADTPSANLIGVGAEPVEVAWFRNSADRPDRIYRSQKTRLTLTTLAAQPVGRLVLEDVQWNYTDDEHPFNLANYDFTEIALDDKIVRAAGSLSLSGDVLQDNIPLHRAKPSAKLRQQYKTLKEECKELAAEIIAEKHSRLAFGVCCVSLVLMGAALGIIFRSGHLLTAFGISFVPAALCLITIFTGKHIAEQNPENIVLGITFLWSGIVIVTVATITTYKLLLKH